MTTYNSETEISAKIQIIAFRHGQTDWNKEGRIQGHQDIPLNALGQEEAVRLALGFRRIPFGMILSSDLSRAYDTATIALAEATKNNWHPPITVLADERLREVNLGKLQGLTHSEIHEKFGKELNGKLGTKILSDEELRDLGSEPAEALVSRVMAAIEFASTHPDFLDAKRIAGQQGIVPALGISTHGGILRRLLHHAGGMEEIRFSIPNGVFFSFEFDPLTKKLVLGSASLFKI